MTASPLFTIQTSNVGEKYLASYEEVITLELYNRADVNLVDWEIFGVSNPKTIVTPTITKLDGPGYTAQLTMPAKVDGYGYSIGIRCTVNNGLIPGTNTRDNSLVATSGIFIASDIGEHPAFEGELYEYDSEHGWYIRYNIFRATDFTLNGDVVGALGSTSVVKIGGKTISGTPTTGRQLVYNGSEIVWSDTRAISGDITIAAGSNTAAITAGAIVNADINASAAIAYSKLNLAGEIVNADIDAAADIAVSKLASGGSDGQAITVQGGTVQYSGTLKNQGAHTHGASYTNNGNSGSSLELAFTQNTGHYWNINANTEITVDNSNIPAGSGVFNFVVYNASNHTVTWDSSNVDGSSGVFVFEEGSAPDLSATGRYILSVLAIHTGSAWQYHVSATGPWS